MAPLVTMLPISMRFGNTYNKFRKDIQISKTNPEFVKEYQERKLREIMVMCEENSSYYTTLFQNVFNKKARNWSINDLKSLPIMSREDVREHCDDLLTRDKDNLDMVTTSGSSGEPLKFYLDKERSAKEIAFVHTVWSGAGFCLKDQRAVLRGVHIQKVDEKPWEYDSALNELRLSPFHITEENLNLYLGLIEKYKVSFLGGYPSAITSLAALALKKKWRRPACFRGIFPISEPIHKHQRNIIAEAFGGVPVLLYYGMSEKVAFAGECLQQEDLYEFEPLYGITELINEEGVCVETPGTRGRIISTGLISLGMPLLNYDTGDTAELVESASYDNCYRMKVRNIKPRRSQDILVGNNGALISLAAINIHSQNYNNVREFQFYQEREGRVVVRAVPSANKTVEDVSLFVNEIQSKVGNAIFFELEMVSEIATNSRGKKRAIDQRLEVMQS